MKNKNIKAVIFDFDGTIADTMPFLTRIAVKLITEKYGLSKGEAKHRYLETTGVDFATQIEIIFPNNPKNHEVVNAFEAKKLEGVFELPLFPDVVSTLTHLKKKSVKTFICSSTKLEIVRRYCKLKGIYTLVDGIFGYKAGFGKYDQISFILKNWRLEPTKVLFIGDSLKDCEFATRNRINFLGIPRIFKVEDFKKRGASTIDNLNGLMEVLEE